MGAKWGLTGQPSSLYWGLAGLYWWEESNLLAAGFPSLTLSSQHCSSHSSTIDTAQQQCSLHVHCSCLLLMYFSLPKCALILRIRVVGPWRIRTGSKVSKSKGALIANPGEIHSLGKVRANPKLQEVRWWGKQSHQVADGVCTIQCPMRSCFKLS